MRVRVRGGLRDLWAFFRLVPERRGRIRRAPAAVSTDPVRELAQSLHPECLELVVDSVKQETASARTYRLRPAPRASQPASRRALPCFRAGQYLSVQFRLAGSPVSRPYSICSSPDEAAEHGYYELTIRRQEDGFVAPYVWEHWRPGTAVRSSGPMGELRYEPLRDSADLVLLAGGCGITPFRSLLRDLQQHHPEVCCMLLYGVRRPDEILYRDELERLAAAAPQRFRVHYVCSEPDAGWQGPAGLLGAACIRELAGSDLSGKTFFVSGPAEMHEYLDRELQRLNLPPGRVRREVRGEVADVTRRADYPRELADRTFVIRLQRDGESLEVPARAAESVLTALERAGLCPPAACRSGECGWCRSRLIRGQVYVIAETDRRRQADRNLGYVHPCSSYPLSDLELDVPHNPLHTAGTAAEPAARR